MSRADCIDCGSVVSTTADPNDNEGFFISLVELEQLEVELLQEEYRDCPPPLRHILKRICKQRLVLCDLCRQEAW